MDGRDNDPAMTAFVDPTKGRSHHARP